MYLCRNPITNSNKYKQLLLINIIAEICLPQDLTLSRRMHHHSVKLTGVVLWEEKCIFAETLSQF